MNAIHLIGAEQVQSAGHAMEHAAQTMRNAASEIDSALDRHRQFMDEWLSRFEDVLTKAGAL